MMNMRTTPSPVQSVLRLTTTEHFLVSNKNLCFYNYMLNIFKPQTGMCLSCPRVRGVWRGRLTEEIGAESVSGALSASPLPAKSSSSSMSGPPIHSCIFFGLSGAHPSPQLPPPACPGGHRGVPRPAQTNNLSSAF